MSNWAGNYTFPFNQSTFLTWWGKYENYTAVGAGYATNSNFIASATAVSTLNLGGTSYTVYKLQFNTTAGPGSLTHFIFWATSDGCRGQNYYDTYRIHVGSITQSAQYNKYETFNSSNNYSRWAIKLTYPVDGKQYYYFVGWERDITQISYSKISQVDPIPNTFQPYQPIVLTNQPSITIRKTTITANSSTSSTSNSDVIHNVTFQSYYTTPNSQGYSSVVYYGGSTSDGSGGWQLTVSISDWTNKAYAFEATGSSFSLYTGKTVGSDFLQAYKIKYTKSNTYHTEVTYPKTSLELAKMSKTIIKESDGNFTFNYDISDFTETATETLTMTVPSTSIHRLASGTTKFNAINCQTSFASGDTVRVLTTSDGSLTYDDGTTISLANASITAFTATTSPSLTLPHTVSIDTPAVFSITHSMTSTYFDIDLSFTKDCSTEDSAQIGNIVFEDYQSVFSPNQVIGYGSNAKVKIYNKDNQLVRTVASADINSIATNVDSKYGHYANEYLQDGVLRLSFFVYGVQLFQGIKFNYDETTLLLNTNSVTLSYIFDPDDNNFEFDYTGLVVKIRHHDNSGNSTVVSDVTLDLTTATVSHSGTTTTYTFPSNLVLTISHDEIDYQQGKNYGITVSTTNSNGQTLTGTFTIYALPLAPQSILFSGSPSSIEYYDNDQEKFKYPVGINFTIVYNDPSYNVTVNNATLSDLQQFGFVFYRNSNHSVQLSAGTSVIARGDGNSIYVYSEEYEVYGQFNIVWLEDTISSVALASAINVYYGNKLNKSSVKSQVSLLCTHASGVISTINNPNDFSFSLTDIIMPRLVLGSTSYLTPPTKAQCTVVLTNVGTFEISNYSTHVVWNAPYAVMTFDLTDFQTEYNNTVDIIFPSGIKAIVSYYEDANHTIQCDFEQECTYSDTATSAFNKFTVTGLDDLSNYNFGSQTLNITMSGTSVVNERIQCTAIDRFTLFNNDYAHVSANVTVSVVEILDVTGIKLLHAKTEYNVGETFLNENDDTQIMIFYNDTNNNPRTYTCYLRSGLTALNIYPLKGTEFKQIIQNRVVTITSANNYNVSVQYSISVKANYIYGNTETHNLVAIALEDYTCPDGVQRSKYFLVDRTRYVNGEASETTVVNIEGKRVLNDGVDVSDLDVYGYLEDINNRYLNARVILFKDFIAPIEGSNNITVKFPCYVEGNADIVNKCHFGIMFGNNNSKNRLFVSGNPDFKNKDWHSGQVDMEQAEDEDMLSGNYGYFEDLSECIYGETDNAVVGYDIVANDKLLVLKDHSDKETTVYFRQPQLVTAINSSGTAVTGLDDETLYQEEFSLSKGNNSVAGVNPKAIVNFNGDSLFISNDKQVVGLDLTGIIGDNSRYANSRSYYIDEELKNHDLSSAILWTNNKYLFVVLKTKIYVTHFETKHNEQYEWFVMDIANVTSILEKSGVIYFGCENGEIFKTADVFKDAKKVFAGYGVTRLSVNEETELITASSYLSELDTSVDPDTGEPLHKYFFKPVPFTDMGQDDDPYIYYSLGSVRNERTSDGEFYVDNSDTRNVIELVCLRNQVTDDDYRKLILKRISELKPIYFNKIDNTESVIVCKANSPFEQAYGKPYYLKEYTGESDKHLYQVIDENGDVMPVKDLYRARICMKVLDETEMSDIDVENGTFKLVLDGEALDIVQYSNQSLITAFRGEIIEYSNVEAFYITKPYTMGSVEYLKTIWSFTLTNDSNIPSELDLCYATNKIPYEKMKTIAQISKDTLGFDISSFNFSKVDFDKNVVPRTYTHKRVLSGVKFACFGFRNLKDSNSVLSSMTITYTVPYPSYSGD